MRRARKVAGVLEHESRVFVAGQPAFPDVVQPPSGALFAGEVPGAGALRETTEECGLEDLRSEQFLGVLQYQPREGVIHERHVYRLACSQPREGHWTVWETSPSHGGESIEFDCCWMPNRAVAPGTDRRIRPLSSRPVNRCFT